MRMGNFIFLEGGGQKIKETDLEIVKKLTELYKQKYYQKYRKILKN